MKHVAAAGPKFRDTLWFKRGELGLEKPEPKPDADEEPSAVMRPIEEMYLDDGSISSDDTAAFGLHVGGSQYVPVIKGGASDPGAHVDVLVREMKRGRRTVLAAMSASVVVTCALLAMYLM